jgi:hypothetical protein
MTSARHIGTVAAALFAAGCSYNHCDTESVDFQLVAPGDAIEIRIEACTGGLRDGELVLALELSADGTPTAPLTLVVDGIVLQSQSGMQWFANGVEELAGDEECDHGKVITLRRLDADPAIEYRGSLSVEMSAPSHRSCSVTISATPL